MNSLAKERRAMGVSMNSLARERRAFGRIAKAAILQDLCQKKHGH
jgi:hypothetical protein